MSSLVEISDTERKLAGRIDNAIATGLSVGERGGVRFVNANQVMEFAKVMAVANVGVRKHLRGNPGACLAVCVQAVEWGMSPYAVANKSYLVNDQIAFESQLVQAVILMRAPIKGRIKFEFTGEGANLRCRAWARLRDEEDEIVEYISPLYKDIAVKNSPLWKADPEQQFAYYSGRALCRRHFPDVLLGVYTDEEFVNGQPMLDADATEVRPAPALRSLDARLDAVANGTSARTAEPSAQDLRDDDHDFGTTDDADFTAPSDSQGADGDGVISNGLDQSGAVEDGDPRHKDLMLKLRTRAIEKGARGLKLAIGGLVPAQNELLTGDDRKYLEGIAAKADEAREMADASAGR